MSKLRWSLVALAAALPCAWLVWQATPPAGARLGDEPPAPSRPRARPPTNPRISPPRRSLRRAPPTKPLASAPSCEPYAKTACYGGNVHWFDSCDRVLDLEQDCGAGFCEAGQCMGSDWPQRCAVPPEGICEGEVLALCDRGKELRIDCGDRGEVCRRGTEGFVCSAVDDSERCAPGPARCAEGLLERCVDGWREVSDCSELGGHCLDLGSAGATCAVLPPKPDPDELQRECGPCGCPASADDGFEACNGVDDDGDGYIDEGASCAPVLVEVWFTEGPWGEAILGEEKLEAEVEYTNQLFEDSGSTLRFELGEVRSLSELVPNESSDLSFDDLLEVLRAPRPGGPPPELTVRLVLAQNLLEDGIPRLGVNVPFVAPTCGPPLVEGGRRFARSLTALAETRTPTTLAHELGHWLGLCHTHESRRPAVATSFEAPNEAVGICGEECRYSGDALCDTPPDDENCRAEPHSCTVQCPNGYQPDPGNLMSYYHACRERFSAEQVRLMEHTLALRRAWHECRDSGCACELGGSECPWGMSCRPDGQLGSSSSCGMDGPRLPGQTCRGRGDCSARSLCLNTADRSLCVRPCQPGNTPCTCLPLPHLGTGLCREDLEQALDNSPGGD